ncbi:MAG TPA: hypothetical protein VLJ39_19340 [Tepidisphaeraceae bacterium]|nr:hypothetical protein [Tepidisphaeraceae bacterium]
MRDIPFLLLVVTLVSWSFAAQPAPIKVTEDDQQIRIETDAIQAVIRKKGYVSGIAAGSFVDKKTGAHDLGFGLHIMDFLLAPGWREDGYGREAKVHGNLPKHYVEGPQICTQAKELHPEIVRGENFVAVRMKFTYTQPGEGYKAGSTWEQTIVFQPGVRYVISAERITSANDVDDLFYRLDMPGHIKHHGPDTFEQVYLSYLKDPIPASAFNENFGPNEKFLYQRKPDQVPARMIRAYQVKLDGKPGPWLAGMTLNPSEVAEAWCHERGYVCFIEELHRRHVKAGESFGAAYVIGWFDDIPATEKVYDQHKGATRIELTAGRFELK